MEIPLFKIYWDESDIEAVTKVIKSGKSWAIGSQIKEFEDKFAKYVGTKYALVFNSGTSALHALMIAYGIGVGDEVIVPSFTFIATANTPLFVGATPVFAEIEERTLGLDPKDVLKKITSKTKAIIPIHYAGCPCRIEELREIADFYNLILIEDAAESLGAKVKGRKVGTFGDSAIFSFCQNKIITTGEGGAVTTNSEDIYEKLKLIRSHGRLETEDYFSSTGYMDYVSLGYNFRMPTMIAALGISQLEKIDKIIEMRRKNAEYLDEYLPGMVPPDDYFHVYQMYTIKTEERDALKHYLEEKGIKTKVYFYPVHLTSFYKKIGYKEGDLPITETISKQVLTLPMYPALTKEEMDYIIEQYDSKTNTKRSWRV